MASPDFRRMADMSSVSNTEDVVDLISRFAKLSIRPKLRIRRRTRYRPVDPLTALPTEILCIISEYLDRPTLRDLSLASMRFRPIAQRILWRSVNVYLDEDSDTFGTVKLLLLQPQLRRYIAKIRLSSTFPPPPTPQSTDKATKPALVLRKRIEPNTGAFATSRCDVSGFPTEVHNLLLACSLHGYFARGLDTFSPDISDSQLAGTIGERLVAALLVLVPCLKDLHVYMVRVPINSRIPQWTPHHVHEKSIIDAYGHPAVDLVLKHLVNQGFEIPSLRSLTFATNEINPDDLICLPMSFNLEHFSTLLGATSLARLTTTCFVYSLRPKFSEQLAHLHELHLWGSTLCCLDLDTLLQLTPRLKDLRLSTFLCKSHSRPKIVTSTVKPLDVSLVRVASTLESLVFYDITINDSAGRQIFANLVDPTACVGELGHLTTLPALFRLKALTIPLGMLYGRVPDKLDALDIVALLPRSLRYLNVVDIWGATSSLDLDPDTSQPTISFFPNVSPRARTADLSPLHAVLASTYTEQLLEMMRRLISGGLPELRELEVRFDRSLLPIPSVPSGADPFDLYLAENHLNFLRGKLLAWRSVVESPSVSLRPLFKTRPKQDI